jgi:hypothetical protein
MMTTLRAGTTDWSGQVGIVRRWYGPHLERIYDAAHVRAGDLEQLEQISGEYPTRERFLTELTLDPPSATGDLAGPPYLDEDYLILSTIHSAKGQEWDVVYVLNAADGCIPSDMSTGKPEQIEEERREIISIWYTRCGSSSTSSIASETPTSTPRVRVSSRTRFSIASSATRAVVRISIATLLPRVLPAAPSESMWLPGLARCGAEVLPGDSGEILWRRRKREREFAESGHGFARSGFAVAAPDANRCVTRTEHIDSIDDADC